MSFKKFGFSGWMILFALGFLLILVSFFFLLTSQIHTGMIFFGLGLIPIALLFINPFHFIRALIRPPRHLELEKIDLEFDS